jgi:hypothetical protein
MRLVHEFEKLWHSGRRPPNAFDFISRNTTSIEDLVSILLVDQRHRWLSSAPWAVEEYLARLPAELTNISEITFKLALGEYKARGSAGQAIGIDELAVRFPEISDRLRDYFSSLTVSKLGSNSVPSTLGSANSPVQAISQSSSVELLEDTSTSSILFSDGELIAKQLGRYELIMIIGEGSFGLVYLGFDSELERKVAIKVPKPRQFFRPEHFRQYLNEA